MELFLLCFGYLGNLIFCFIFIVLWYFFGLGMVSLFFFCYCVWGKYLMFGFMWFGMRLMLIWVKVLEVFGYNKFIIV